MLVEKEKAFDLFETALSRKVGIEPEQKLVCALIVNAAKDAFYNNRYGNDKAEAHSFFFDGRLDIWCEFVDVETQFVREMFQRLEAKIA